MCQLDGQKHCGKINLQCRLNQNIYVDGEVYGDYFVLN